MLVVREGKLIETGVEEITLLNEKEVIIYDIKNRVVGKVYKGGVLELISKEMEDDYLKLYIYESVFIRAIKESKKSMLELEDIRRLEKVGEKEEAIEYYEGWIKRNEGVISSFRKVKFMEKLYEELSESYEMYRKQKEGVYDEYIGLEVDSLQGRPLLTRHLQKLRYELYEGSEVIQLMYKKYKNMLRKEEGYMSKATIFLEKSVGNLKGSKEELERVVDCIYELDRVFVELRSWIGGYIGVLLEEVKETSVEEVIRTVERGGNKLEILAKKYLLRVLSKVLGEEYKGNYIESRYDILCRRVEKEGKEYECYKAVTKGIEGGIEVIDSRELLKEVFKKECESCYGNEIAIGVRLLEIVRGRRGYYKVKGGGLYIKKGGEWRIISVNANRARYKGVLGELEKKKEIEEEGAIVEGRVGIYILEV